MKSRSDLLKELEKPLNIPVEEKIEMERILPALVKWQNYPDLALICLSGVFLPPHQRTCLYILNSGMQTNVNVSSRGTSKSSTVATLYSNYKALVFSGRSMVQLSATGFRGGQLIFVDTEKWITGGWSDQLPTPRFFRSSIPRENLINRSQNFWSISYSSNSHISTYPTNDPDKLRGIRGTDLLFDEANTTSRYLMDTVATLFLAVKSNFRHGGAYSNPNQIYYTSTIDFDWRPFMDDVRAAKVAINRDYEAYEAAKKRQWNVFEALEREGLYTSTYVSFDYTDCLIRKYIVTRDNKVMKVRWPNPDIQPYRDIRGIPFLERLPDGRMNKESKPITYFQTYPIDKATIEKKLTQGTMDESSWLSENRNIIDTSTGDVYSYNLVDKAACRADYHIVPYDQTSPEYRELHKDDRADYCAPLLWECSDPCVLGVDYATESDFSAFCVIRIGPCAEGEYNYLTHHGNTKWSNVIWAEQHKHTSHKDVGDKIRDLMGRYNLVWHHDAAELDPWKRCRAIGLDLRGGGSGVRDELAYINDDVVPLPKFRIYDPQDKDPRIGAFAMDTNAKPMLDAFWPQGDLNDKMVTFTIAQMEIGMLYIAKFLPDSIRLLNRSHLDIGYYAAATLTHQLVKLRQEPTSTWRRFYMEGDKDKDKNKKDLWSAFIYASKQVRAHLIRQQMIDDTPPPTALIVTRANAGGGYYGRIPGARDDYRKMR